MNQYIEVTALSLYVSLTSALLAFVLAVPVAAILVVAKFRFQKIMHFVIYSMMAVPSVVVGLVIYIMLSNRGILGFMELIYTPTAMIIAQFVLILPLMIGFCLPIITHEYERIEPLFFSLKISRIQAMVQIIYEVRRKLISVFVTGYGRALAEVAAVMVVGGNILHETRVLTTAIMLEIDKGNIDKAINFGIILLVLAMIVNIISYWMNKIWQ